MKSKSGILLCEKEDSLTRYFVCKLTTKQCQILPHPNSNTISALALGMVVLKSSRPNNNDNYNLIRYKIVRLFFNPSDTCALCRSLCCEIFDSDSWSWKQLNDIQKLHRSAKEGFNKPLVSAGGKLYWLLSCNNEDEIFEFDPENESRKFMSLPDELREREVLKRMAVVECEGGVGLICIKLEEKARMELWIKVEVKSGKILWRKTQSVCVREIMKYNPKVYALALRHSDVAVLVDGYKKLVLYDFQDGNIYYRTYPERLVPRNFHLLQSNFEPVNLLSEESPWLVPCCLICLILVFGFELLFPIFSALKY